MMYNILYAQSFNIKSSQGTKRNISFSARPATKCNLEKLSNHN